MANSGVGVDAAWRLPRTGWAYVVGVTILAAVCTFGDVLPAYLVLLATTFPAGVAAQLLSAIVALGAQGTLGDAAGWAFPVLGVAVVAVWSLAGWVNAKLAQLTVRLVRCW